YWLGDDLAVLTAHLRTAGRHSFLALTLGWTAITAIIALPPSLVAGYQFPLLFALKGRGKDGVAGDVGRIYAANTLGAIAGSLAGGFGLLPLLSAPGAWVLSALLLIVVAIMFGVRAASFDRPRALLIGVLLVLFAIAAGADGPTATWRHDQIG